MKTPRLRRVVILVIVSVGATLLVVLGVAASQLPSSSQRSSHLQVIAASR
jgi:hypothetical protein